MNSALLPTDGWLRSRVTGRWIPDAFARPGRALRAEVADGAPAPGCASIGSGAAQAVAAR